MLSVRAPVVHLSVSISKAVAEPPHSKRRGGAYLLGRRRRRLGRRIRIPVGGFRSVVTKPAYYPRTVMTGHGALVTTL